MPFQPDCSGAFLDDLDDRETLSTFSTLGPLLGLLEKDAKSLLDDMWRPFLLCEKRVEFIKDRLAVGKNEALDDCFASDLQCLTTPFATILSKAKLPLINLAMLINMTREYRSIKASLSL